MSTYYNDNDPFKAQWLRNMIAAGRISRGDVDERSVTEIRSEDLKGYTRVHLFAGVGGWDEALQIAGWPEDRPVWTGSCPCQPVSCAGPAQGDSDKRHLWPAFFDLIEESRPAVIFGEQVSGTLGREWMSAVRLDLETCGYACGILDLPALCVYTFHRRQRLWFMAHPHGIGRSPGNSSQNGRATGGIVKPGSGPAWFMGDAESEDTRGDQRSEAEKESGETRRPDLSVGYDGGGHGSYGHWDSAVLVPCADGRARALPPPESGIHPLADGIPKRVGRLRAYGDAIVPQVGARFVEFYLKYF